MSVAPLRSLVVGVALVGLGCAPAPKFECQSDDDCVLAGAKGQCQPTGSCAYADDDCESGWAYPAGAPVDLAGQCAPGTAAAGTTDTSAVTDSGRGETSTTAVSTGMVADGASTGSTSLPMPPATTSDDGPGSDTGPSCERDDFPDRMGAAKPMRCQGEPVSGVLGSADDLDWINYGTCPGRGLEVTVEAEGEAVQACVVVACEKGNSPGLKCSDGQPWEGADGISEGCCAPTSFFVTPQCMANAQVYLLARANPDVAGGERCAPYSVALSAG